MVTMSDLEERDIRVIWVIRVSRVVVGSVVVYVVVVGMLVVTM